jgi:EAL domain-containing protein (putative c-di-GMP-specific phosphodiesterase class I)
MFPLNGVDFDTLATQSDVAMYRAKEMGRNTFCFFTAEMQTECTRALLLDNLLRRAIDRGEFSLHFQPQCSLKDGTLTGVEALLRWNCGELGPVSPAEFIPIAENSGLIVPIGDWVLRAALAQMRQWIDQDIAPPKVAVNLSAVQFRQPGFPDRVRRLVDEQGVPPSRLELELTESVASDDPAGAMAVMDALSAHGIGLSIDDFGTGYSSLSYLKRFKVGKLKIDRSFVANVTDSAADQAIVSTIIRLANGLGMVTIAEGVETPAQLDALRQRGCDEVQGYWIARPFPAEDLPVYREAHANSQWLLRPRRQGIHSRWTLRRRSAR